MKHFYLLLFVLLLISCDKKKKPDSSNPKPVAVEVTDEGKVLAIDSTYLSKKNDSILVAFYQANDNKTFWLAFNCRESLLTVLKNVEEEGLNSKDFDLKKIGKLEKSIPTLSDKELIDFDFLLTQNLKKYVEKEKSLIRIIETMEKKENLKEL